MARPRVPTKILEMSGAFRKNPGRARSRVGEPEPRGSIGEPPAGLTEEILGCWHDIVSTCAPGVLTSADRIAVMSAARLLARENKGIISTGERGQLHKLLADFGMTPKGRAYVRGSEPEEETDSSFATL
jgi:hypothetical protein